MSGIINRLDRAEIEDKQPRKIHPFIDLGVENPVDPRATTEDPTYTPDTGLTRFQRRFGTDWQQYIKNR